MDTANKTYRTFIFATILPGPTRKAADMTIQEIAEYCATLSADYGRPTKAENMTRQSDGIQIAHFVFAPDSYDGQDFTAYGVTVEQIREAYRAAKAA